MRILFIRHGDPDYVLDSLTETGKTEADLLSVRMKNETIDDIYVSPLGRAKETAAPTLAARGEKAEELDWLEEFPAELDINGNPFLERAFPDTPRREDGSYDSRIVWDMLPSCWKDDERYYDRVRMGETPVGKASDLMPVYRRVCGGIDGLLSKYGYRREGNLYRTDHGNGKTIALFCHYGVTCAMLSHLWNISPFVLWHGMVMAPSSVTEVYTEEREKGIVLFRATKFGDISHLYAAGQEPSFAARFCSVYDSPDERH